MAWRLDCSQTEEHGYGVAVNSKDWRTCQEARWRTVVPRDTHIASVCVLIRDTCEWVKRAHFTAWRDACTLARVPNLTGYTDMCLPPARRPGPVLSGGHGTRCASTGSPARSPCPAVPVFWMPHRRWCWQPRTRQHSTGRAWRCSEMRQRGDVSYLCSVDKWDVGWVRVVPGTMYQCHQTTNAVS